MAQEVESANAYQLAGQTVELSFNANTGANFSAANYNMTAYVVYGTGADEGISKLAYGINAGGGGGSGWTGQTNATAAVIGLGGVSTAGRYVAVANVPSTATEVGVALCWTPVGTAGTNDYVAFDGIQLVRNPALAQYVSTTTGYSTATVPATAFDRRSFQVEAVLQERYFWEISEPAASVAVGSAGTYYTTTTCLVPFAFPVTMRIAPTVSFGGTALSSSTFAVIANSATPIALATTYLVQSALGANTTYVGALKATTAAQTAGQACMLVGAGGGANIQWSAEL
jgi:hypothetical protein